jgi:digeranylgeranylglycerophospholipid reductase
MSAPLAVDILIVGGGFAGLAAAREAALAGASVLVIDAKPEIGSRLHTTGILTREAHDVLRPPAALVRRVDGVRLYTPGRRTLDLASHRYAFYTTATGDLLRWQAAEAVRAGAQVLVDARLEHAVRDEAGRMVAQVSGGRTVQARYILGADGARSRVAELFKLGRNTKFVKGVEREYSGRGRLDAGWLHVFVDSKTAPGYIAWACAAPDVTQVGVGVGWRYKPDIDAFASEAEGIFGLSSGDEVERRAGLIPSGGLVKPISADGVMLVGDSAGMVSPHTAGGIHMSLLFGAMAGRAAAEHLAGRGPVPEEVLKPHLPNMLTKLLLRFALDLAPPNVLIETAFRFGPALGMARETFFHEGVRER